VTSDIVDAVHDANIELAGPVAAGCTRDDMPVIMWLVVDQDRCFTGRVDNVGKGQARKRCPIDEMRIWFEWHLVVVKKCVLRIA